MNLSTTYEELRFIMTCFDNVKNPNYFEKELMLNYLKKAYKQVNLTSLRSIIKHKIEVLKK